MRQVGTVTLDWRAAACLILDLPFTLLLSRRPLLLPARVQDGNCKLCSCSR